MRKYRNIPTELDGYRFDSKREARRYQDLKLLVLAGEISDLCAEKLELRFDLSVNGMKICTYEADFRYKDKDENVVVEDSKGVRTPVYRLKKKLMKALLGIEIQEV